MNNVSKKMISHGGIYLLGNILSKAVSFIMLPIYTRCLTPADYGILELLSLVIDFVAVILGMRISQAIFRFYSEYDDQEQKNSVVATAIMMIGVFNLVRYCADRGIRKAFIPAGF